MAKKNSRYIPKAVKDAVQRRDRDICQLCGNQSEYMEFDHITPFSLGAPATVGNIQQLCRKCNLKKRDKTTRECSRCRKWNAHDAEYCHHCGAAQPKFNLQLRREREFREELDVRGGRELRPRREREIREELSTGEEIIWILRKLVGVVLILIAAYMAFRLWKH